VDSVPDPLLFVMYKILKYENVLKIDGTFIEIVVI
jgi:hypothetical protein